MSSFLKGLFSLAVGAVTFWSFAVPNADPALGFPNPELARIFFFHFPCPMLASILLILSGWFAWRFVRTGDRAWDVRMMAAIELGFLFCILTMLTGILFSRVEWGAWWQWDPRQTSFLLVLLIYAAFFALRSSISDENHRAATSAVYNLAALLPTLFLIFVFPRLPQVMSFHPTNTITGGNIVGEYAYLIWSIVALMVVLAVWLYRLGVRAGLLELSLENSDGKLAIGGGDPAPTGVVRPVSVSGQD